MNFSLHQRPECFGRRDRRHFLGISVALAIFAVLCLCMVGCSSTIAPAPVQSQQASFDGAEQNSGVLAMIPGGAVITQRARERYNALIVRYGKEFGPPLASDHGITARSDGTYAITSEGLQKFILMNAWKRMGRDPGRN